MECDACEDGYMIPFIDEDGDPALPLPRLRRDSMDLYYKHSTNGGNE